MCRRYLVSGRVQGVGYRAFARRAAGQLGVNGHAINLPDGRVEVLACGEATAVAALVERLRQGPHWSEVDAVSDEPAACVAPGFRTA